MSVEFIAPLVLVFVVAALFLGTQVIAPWKARRRIRAALLRLGWSEVHPEDDSAWNEILKLAIERGRGDADDRENEQAVGPFTMKVATDWKRSAKVLEVYRETGTGIRRYAAVGIQQERYRARSILHNRDRTSASREFWIGEARPIGVKVPGRVFSATAGMIGEAARRMVLSRGGDPDIAELSTRTPDSGMAGALHDRLSRTGLAKRLLAEIYVAPRSWVLAVPLAKVGRDIEEVLALARDISQSLDR